MSLSQLNRMTAITLAREIAQHRVSPVEALEAALARVDETELQLNAFVQVDAEGARAAARGAESDIMLGRPLGPLHGAPVRYQEPLAPLAHARRLERRSRGLGGRRGHGHRPGDRCGSSVRAPCSLTGLVGIKANFGRIPVWPGSATSTLAHVGPIARNVDDAALLLSVCAGPDARDPFSLMPPIGEPPARAEVSRLRVAFSPTLGYGRPDAPVAVTVSEAVGKLGAVFPNMELVETSAPTRARFSSPSSSADAAHGSEMPSTAHQI